MSGFEKSQWLSVWATARQLLNTVDLGYQHAGVSFENSTVRQTVLINETTDRIRLNLSNLYGSTPLCIESITVAAAAEQNGTPAGSAAVDLSFLRSVASKGETRFTLPPKCCLTTDDISIHLESGSHLSISIYLAKGQAGRDMCGHFIGKTTTWIRRGDCTRRYDLSDGRQIQQYLWLASVEALVPSRCGTISCFGDSITDTLLAVNSYAGWPDGLARGLKALDSDFSVLNFGISGDRLTTGGMARFPRDIIRPSHGRAGYLIIHIGVNDIGITPPDQGSQDDIFQRLTSAYEQACRMAHEHDIVVIGSTIMPFLSPPGWKTPWEFADPRRDVTRQRVNRWILTCGHFDHILDFSAAVTDPNHPNRMCHEYHNGDYLHPSAEGFKVMAKTIPLSLFK